MTEAEWEVCTDPERMLGFLTQGMNSIFPLSWWKVIPFRVSRRALRLFAVACCRRIENLLTEEAGRKAVEVAERYADGLASDRELRAAYSAAAGGNHASRAAAASCAADPAWAALFASRGALDATAAACPDAADGMWWVQAALVRDIFGNPWKTVVLDPGCLSPDVTAVVQPIYDKRRFSDLPVLGDALEEAGWKIPALVEHCRSGGEHVRGCWAVDLLLARA
jgi:hypothetical protein